MTEELKQLRRKRQRAYKKGAKSSEYLNLRLKFKTKLKSEAEKYRKKIYMKSKMENAKILIKL